MKVEQIYTGCLAEAAYYIESNGEAVIIDPMRETKPYMDMLEENGTTLKYILETHFHADFVSGHIDLAKKTGAEIVYGPTAEADFDFHRAEDEEILNVGDVQIKVLHTPGHTMESTCFLLMDENGNDYCIFSGDTLFIGDVGRPDLAVKTDLSQKDLALHLYDSIKNKILPLRDEIIVYPGHGAGSACGKNLSSETFDTLGNQKKTNYALQATSKEDFVAKVLDGLMPPPQYFPKNAMMNKQGYESFDSIMEKSDNALTPEQFEMVAETEGALVIDTREPQEFVDGFIPNSVFIGANGSFASWIGTLITDLKQPILLVADEGNAEEVVTRMARVGYENCLGYLKGGFKSWKESGKEIDNINTISAKELAALSSKNNNVKIIDARKVSEFDAEHVEGAINLPLDFINHNMAEYKKDETYYVHCKSGYRSTINISILKARGYENFVNVEGGFDALLDTEIPKTNFECQSKA